jgi:hypothetical protein
MAITLICIGIPVCRPLYKRAFRRLFGEISSAGYRKQSGGKDEENNSVPLRTIGGGLVGTDGKPIVGSKKQQPSANNSRNKTGLDDTCVDKTTNGSTDDVSFSDVKLGVNGPFTRTTVRGRTEGSDNASQEEILGDEYRRSQIQTGRRSDEERDSASAGSGGARAPPPNPHGQNGIMVTETYRVERT